LLLLLLLFLIKLVLNILTTKSGCHILSFWSSSELCSPKICDVATTAASPLNLSQSPMFWFLILSNTNRLTNQSSVELFPLCLLLAPSISHTIRSQSRAQGTELRICSHEIFASVCRIFASIYILLFLSLSLKLKKY